MSIYDMTLIHSMGGKITRYGSIQTLVHWVLRPLGIRCAKDTFFTHLFTHYVNRVKG